ncbi:MAG: Cyclase, partial [Aeromicrobium sp.]|nr:Cyclase [Aeromicrobium sp.]
MARTASDIVIDAPADQIMDVIADFGAYPDWAT